MYRLLAYANILALTLLGLALPAQANLIDFNAVLNGSSEVPANGSPATGVGSVVLDNVADTITVDLSWSGLTTPVTAAHIQGPAAPGVNGPVVFPLSGAPAATSGSIPEQSFSISPAEIVELDSGLFYFNIHDADFPGGEIRGQITLAVATRVPEPSTLLLLGVGLLGAVGFRRKVISMGCPEPR